MRVLEDSEIIKNKVILHKNDEKILALLCFNIRLPLSKIAKLLRLSRQSVEYRIKVMQRHHLIAGSRAVINIKKIGYQSYHFFLTMQNTSSEKTFIELCKNHLSVNALISYSGKFNYEVSIMEKNPNAALIKLLSLIKGLEVADIMPTILLENIKSSVLPSLQEPKLSSLKYIRNDPSFVKQFFAQQQNYIPDDKDLELLYQLSQNAQLTLSDLGNKIKLTNDAVAYRIKKLVRAGYILEFRPVIDYAVLGLSIQAVLLKVRNRTPELDTQFHAHIKQNTSVVWATSLFGNWDYLIYLLHERQEEIHSFIESLKDKLSNNFSSYDILFAYKEHKYSYMTEAMRKG